MSSQNYCTGTSTEFNSGASNPGPQYIHPTPHGPSPPQYIRPTLYPLSPAQFNQPTPRRPSAAQYIHPLPQNQNYHQGHCTLPYVTPDGLEFPNLAGGTHRYKAHRSPDTPGVLKPTMQIDSPVNGRQEFALAPMPPPPPDDIRASFG
ncbi:hypothetical protein M422DRAFT_42883 [Sphaerobolus stellatus SS14]|nr:hypothetical protein M422DRAFT_42883 [Sphaerobolus stellatus SS14]